MTDESCYNCNYSIMCEYGFICLLRKGLLKNVIGSVCDDWNDNVSKSELIRLSMEFNEFQRENFEERLILDMMSMNKENINSNCETNTGRFSLRSESDYAIIDELGEIAPIMVDMKSSDDGSESGYADRSSVLKLLNNLDYASKNKQINGSVTDGLLFLEEDIILLEKIMKEIDYIGRRNFKESQEYARQREERYLIGIQRQYEKLFDECWKLIRQIRSGLNE